MGALRDPWLPAFFPSGKPNSGSNLAGNNGQKTAVNSEVLTAQR
jgi:hypothetical protein